MEGSSSDSVSGVTILFSLATISRLINDSGLYFRHPDSILVLLCNAFALLYFGYKVQVSSTRSVQTAIRNCFIIISAKNAAGLITGSGVVLFWISIFLYIPQPQPYLVICRLALYQAMA